jgi:NitT/TauT family transport system substrate-binding protein
MLISMLIMPLAMAPSQSTQSVQAQDVGTVRVAVIPVLDTLPMFIAQEEGYFQDEGLEVELIPVSSPIERDQLVQAGEADAMLTDIPGVGFFNEVRNRLQIVYTTRVATEDGPVFRILAGPGSDIETAEGLAGVPIGVSEATIIEYLTYRLLENAGVDDVATEVVPAIPLRFQLLMSGELEAATLPDPLAQAAIEAGATLVLDDTVFAEEQFAQSVLVFTSSYVEDNPEAVAAFIRAWDRAVVDLNDNPEDYRELFLERTTVPESVQETYEIPPFPRGLITSEAVWEDYMDWMLELDIIEEAPAYDDSVNDDFMPDIPEDEMEEMDGEGGMSDDASEGDMEDGEE